VPSDGWFAALPLRPLPPELLGQVAAIEALVFPEPTTPTELERLFGTPGTVYLYYGDERQVYAYLGFRVVGATAHILANATHPAYQGRGLGRRILPEGEPLARARGARWYLGEVRASNTVQRALLRALGWVEVATVARFFGNGEDAVVVWKDFDVPPAEGGR
jgi:ribosomal protein S18 acetylase RimI-like enzyme